MERLTVKINGEVIDNVASIHCSSDYSKMRIVRRLGNRTINQDYDATAVEIDIVGKLINYNLPITCTVVGSKNQFIGAEGRYKAEIKDKDLGIIRITEGDDWIDIKVHMYELEDVETIINDEGGTLSVEISNSGLGKIHRKGE
jgi:hypothetical protein